MEKRGNLKNSYTALLVINAIYIVIFFILMQIFS
jgi:hypothetical protein